MHHISRNRDESAEDAGDGESGGCAMEIHERTVETDEDGEGRTMVRYDGEYDEEPHVLVSSSAGVAEWTGRGTSQVSATVRDAPADAEVVVTVAVTAR